LWVLRYFFWGIADFFLGNTGSLEEHSGSLKEISGGLKERIASLLDFGFSQWEKVNFLLEKGIILSVKRVNLEGKAANQKGNRVFINGMQGSQRDLSPAHD